MKSISVLAMLSLITSILFSFFLVHHNALYVIGGEYVIPKGETLNGDVYALFADVTLEEGSRVGGSVYSLGSDVDVKGMISGDILSFDFFGYTVLIPELRRLQISH